MPEYLSGYATHWKIILPFLVQVYLFYWVSLKLIDNLKRYYIGLLLSEFLH